MAEGAAGAATYCLQAPTTSLYDNARIRFDYLKESLPVLGENVEDCASLVHDLRRSKQESEVVCIQKAIDITLDAHRSAARSIAPGAYEYHIRADIERVFIHGKTI